MKTDGMQARANFVGTCEQLDCVRKILDAFRVLIKHGDMPIDSLLVSGVLFQFGIIVELAITQIQIRDQGENFLARVRLPMRNAERCVNCRSPMMQLDVRELRVGWIITVHFCNDQVPAQLAHTPHFRKLLRQLLQVM